MRKPRAPVRSAVETADNSILLPATVPPRPIYGWLA
jgi:hypothetical protein